MLRAVLFDIDGTLTNSDPLHFDAFVEILQEKGFDGGQPISEAFFRERISGRHNPEIAAELFPHWTKEQQDAFSDDKEQRFRNLAAQHGLQPMPGLPDFLDWVKSRGLRVAAVTNAPRANGEAILAALGLDGFFEHVVYGEDCERAKPHPDPYQVAMRLLGVEGTPALALVCEDSPSGMQAGVAAGCPVVGITSGHDPERLKEVGASLLVTDFTQLLALVREASTEA